MLYVNMYISTFLLLKYYCIYTAYAILLISTCLTKTFDRINDRICENGRFLFHKEL